MIEISIVIPAHNAARTLPATLRSLEGLDFDTAKFEVLIVDDGSTDATPDILSAFRKQTRLRFEYFRRDRSDKRGAGLARNVGITAASGRLIAFTDADCIVDPGWLREIDRAMTGAGHSFISGEIHSDDQLVFPWKIAPAGHRASANLAYDRAKVGQVFFDPAIKNYIGEDIDLMIRIEAMGHPLRHVPTAKVSHPANVLGWRPVVSRVMARKNDVLIHKLHGRRMTEAMHPVFRPVIFGRVSPATAATLTFMVAAAGLPALDRRVGLSVIAVTSAVAAAAFIARWYRFCLLNKTADTRLSVRDRCKTLMMLVIYFPAFVWSRIVGSIEFGHFML